MKQIPSYDRVHLNSKISGTDGRDCGYRHGESLDFYYGYGYDSRAFNKWIIASFRKGDGYHDFYQGDGYHFYPFDTFIYEEK